jgi:hypothetical protein
MRGDANLINQIEPALSNGNISHNRQQQHCFLSSFHNKNATIKYSEKSNNINSLTVGTKFPLLEDRMKNILSSDVAAATTANGNFLQPCTVQLTGSNSSSSGCDIMNSSYTSSPCSVSSMVSSEFTNATDTTRTTMSRTINYAQQQKAYMTQGSNSNVNPATMRYATTRISNGSESNDGHTSFRSSVV